MAKWCPRKIITVTKNKLALTDEHLKLESREVCYNILVQKIGISRKEHYTEIKR